MDKLIISETDRGRYAVRPMNWVGIWNEKGQIKESLNHLALFIKKEDAEKFVEWKNAEEQGRLLKLPCAVGDEFYCIWRNKGQNPIQKMQVKKIEIHERKGIVIQMEFVGNRGCLFRFYEDDFGKTVFLTIEEAEAALKELERGKGE